MKLSNIITLPFYLIMNKILGRNIHIRKSGIVLFVILVVVIFFGILFFIMNLNTSYETKSILGFIFTIYYTLSLLFQTLNLSNN